MTREPVWKNTVAGGGASTADGALATRTHLAFVVGVAADVQQRFWIADSGEQNLRYVTPSR